MNLIQCSECKFGESLKSGKALDDSLICSQYPEGIPDYVEKIEKDCPKFEEN